MSYQVDPHTYTIEQLVQFSFVSKLVAKNYKPSDGNPYEWACSKGGLQTYVVDTEGLAKNLVAAHPEKSDRELLRLGMNDCGGKAHPTDLLTRITAARSGSQKELTMPNYYRAVMYWCDRRIGANYDIENDRTVQRHCYEDSRPQGVNATIKITSQAVPEEVSRALLLKIATRHGYVEGTHLKFFDFNRTFPTSQSNYDMMVFMEKNGINPQDDA